MGYRNILEMVSRSFAFVEFARVVDAIAAKQGAYPPCTCFYYL